MNKIKEKIASLRKLFISETPVLYRYIQTISVAIAALPLYYASLPSQFQSSIPDSWLKYITISGAACAFLLQFKTTKKQIVVSDEINTTNEVVYSGGKDGGDDLENIKKDVDNDQTK